VLVREGFMDRSGKKQVLIAGGGVAALEAALELRSIAPDHVDVRLLAPEPHFWYRPLAVTAPFDLGDVVHFELDGLTRAIGVDLTSGALVGIDAWRHIAHTSKNTQLEYDALLIACGALSMPAVRGAATFRGPADLELMEDLLRDVSGGGVHSVAFVIPWGAVYALPAYELALLLARRVVELGIDGVAITIVTPEESPLQVFGPPGSEAVLELLSELGIELRTGVCPMDVVDGTLRLVPDGGIDADRVVALPRLLGAPIDGVPQTVDGFVPVDGHCRVHGIADVYAAGDITSFPVKHGSIAAEQASVAAEAIAAAAGVDIEPERFRPVLRGMLLTGARPRFLRRELGVDHDAEPVASPDALWWPPAKIVGRRLGPFLASLVAVEGPGEIPVPPGALEIEHPLDANAVADLDVGGPWLDAENDDERLVEDVMTRAPLVLAPEDTLGESAERMLERQTGAAVIEEYGRLIGILTSSDLIRAAAARAHPADARVRQWMTAEPVTVDPRAPVSRAIALMGQWGIDHLPVVDAESALGMIDRGQVDCEPVLTAGLGF
jgi:sulfide:quinone oxidoreductase